MTTLASAALQPEEVRTRGRARVLVLDGHTNQALAVVRSLGRAGCAVLVASAWPRPLASWSRHCVDWIRLPETAAGYRRALEWAVERGVQVVLPLTETSCLLCNVTRKDWEGTGIIVGCSPDEILRRAFDKRRTLELARTAGVRIPATVVPSSLDEAREAARTVGFPCVIKPRFSHAWTGTGFLPDRGCAYAGSWQDFDAAVMSRRQGNDWPLIQEYVPGTGKGVFALCDSGHVVAWFAHERLRDVRPTGSGSSLRRSIPLPSRLQQPAARLLEAMAWHGPAMVEFRDSGDRGPVLMEVNGRFWNSLQLAVDAGVDFPRLWLATLVGDRLPHPPDYEAGVTVRWLWGDVKRFLYVMAGPPVGYTEPYPSIRQGLRELFGRQERRTRLEIWRRDDPWPAVGEWVQAAQEIWRQRTSR